jgi:hypothetical protein
MRADAMRNLHSAEAMAATVKRNPEGETFRGALARRLSRMQEERRPFETPWRNCADYILPERPSGFLSSAHEDDDELESHANILDGSAYQSVENAKAGLLQGMASPERPWFQYGVDVPSIAADDDVRTWLEAFRDAALGICDKSNWYTSLSELFRDELVFGTAALGMYEDDKKVIRCEVYPIGSFYLGQNPMGQVDTFARIFHLPVRRVAEMYGAENLTQGSRNLLARAPETKIELAHMILRNVDGDVAAFWPENLPWSDVVFETGGMSTGASRQSPQYTGVNSSAEDTNKLLSLSGYHEFPIMAVRWTRNPEHVYACSWPARIALPDIVTLQDMEQDTLNALKKGVDPPLVGGPELKGNPISLVSGDVSIDPSMDYNSRVRAIHEVHYQVDPVEAKADRIRDRISRAFYEHIFLMLLGDNRAQPSTALEVQERVQEKLSILGPTMERHSFDFFDPSLDRLANIMIRRSQAAWDRGEDGVAPVPPDILRDVEWRPQYISEIAQAQKLVGVNSLERHWSFIAGVAQIDPEVVDVFDSDFAARRHASSLGLAADTSRDEETVMARRQARAEAMARQQQMEAAPAVARAARDLSETPVEDGRDSALNRILN